MFLKPTFTPLTLVTGQHALGAGDTDTLLSVLGHVDLLFTADGRPLISPDDVIPLPLLRACLAHVDAGVVGAACRVLRKASGLLHANSALALYQVRGGSTCSDNNNNNN